MLRIVSKKNPLGLAIGESVTCHSQSFVCYNDRGEKHLYKRAIQLHKQLVVVGIVKKAIVGTYIPQGRYSEDYCPAYLTGVKYQLFYECKRDIYYKVVLVHPDDITLEAKK